MLPKFQINLMYHSRISIKYKMNKKQRYKKGIRRNKV